MIKLKVFPTKQYDEANEFIANVDIAQDGVEVKEGNILIFYKNEMPLAELEANRIAKRLRIAEEALVDQLIHKQFLKVVQIDGDEEKIKDAQKKNAQEIKNLEAQISLYKTWKILSK